MLCCVLFCLDSSEAENFIHTQLTLSLVLFLSKKLSAVLAHWQNFTRISFRTSFTHFRVAAIFKFSSRFSGLSLFFSIFCRFPFTFYFQFFSRCRLLLLLLSPRYFRIHGNQIHKSPAGLAFNASTLSACGSMDLLHPRHIKSTISFSIHAIHLCVCCAYPLLWCMAIHSFTFNLTYHASFLCDRRMLNEQNWFFEHAAVKKWMRHDRILICMHTLTHWLRTKKTLFTTTCTQTRAAEKNFPADALL